METHKFPTKWFPWQPKLCDTWAISLLTRILNIVKIGLKLTKESQVALFRNIFSKTTNLPDFTWPHLCWVKALISNSSNFVPLICDVVMHPYKNNMNYTVLSYIPDLNAHSSLCYPKIVQDGDHFTSMTTIITYGCSLKICLPHTSAWQVLINHCGILRCEEIPGTLGYLIITNLSWCVINAMMEGIFKWPQAYEGDFCNQPLLHQPQSHPCHQVTSSHKAWS